MYLVDAFIQSEFRLYIYRYCQYVCSLGIEPKTFALLTQCSTTEPQEHLPLPFKIHKLKLRIENTPNGNTSISQTLQFIAKKFFRLHEVVFQAIQKKVYFAKLQWLFHIYRSPGLRDDNVIILLYSITSKNTSYMATYISIDYKMLV